jgi:hypothetical protein
MAKSRRRSQASRTTGVRRSVDLASPWWALDMHQATHPGIVVV